MRKLILLNIGHTINLIVAVFGFVIGYVGTVIDDQEPISIGVAMILIPCSISFIYSLIEKRIKRKVEPC